MPIPPETSPGIARVAVVGSLNMDLVARAPRLPSPGETLMGSGFAQVAGGKGGNQAVAAARLGARVAMIGCVGDDANGLILRRELEAEGIDCGSVGISNVTPTGVALIVVDDSSQNAIVVIAGSNGEVTPGMIQQYESVLRDAAVVVCQLETPPAAVGAALATGRELGKITILNPAPVAGPLPREWFSWIDFLIPNELEAAELTGIQILAPADAARAAEILQERGARNVIVTLGARGVYALLAGSAGRHFQAAAVKAIDTTAAGDTFIGGFAAALARGTPVEEAIAFGQHAAAIAVTRAGAQPSIPFLREL